MAQEDKPRAHRRSLEVADWLREVGDARWTAVARRHLQELALDAEGVAQLSEAIKAMLRSGR